MHVVQVGNLGLWAVDADDNGDDDGVYQFKPHTGSIPRLEFDALDGNKVVSTSYDGTVRRMDVEKGAFEQVSHPISHHRLESSVVMAHPLCKPNPFNVRFSCLGSTASMFLVAMVSRVILFRRNFHI